MILNVLQLVNKKRVISVGAIIEILFVSLSLWMAFAKNAFLWLVVLGVVELVLTIVENASKQKE